MRTPVRLAYHSLLQLLSVTTVPPPISHKYASGMQSFTCFVCGTMLQTDAMLGTRGMLGGAVEKFKVVGTNWCRARQLLTVLAMCVCPLPAVAVSSTVSHQFATGSTYVQLLAATR